MRLSFALVGVVLLSRAAHAGNVELVSRAATFDDTGADASGFPALSADGRYVAFQSRAPNLAPGVTVQGGTYNIFLFDRVAGTTVLVSASAANPGHAANGESTYPSISADGRYVAYSSSATDVVPGQVDSNGTGTDIFLFDRITGSNTLVSHSASSAVRTGSAVSEAPNVSGDGRFVAFQSDATDLVAGQVGPFSRDVYLWDRTTGAVSLVSHAAGLPMQGGSYLSDYPRVSQDGSTIIYDSLASDLVPGQISSGIVSALYAFDRVSGTTTLVSHPAGSPTTPAEWNSYFFVSADGRYVSFMSSATNLVPGQAGAGVLLFLHDRALDSTILVSRSVGSPTTGANASSVNQRLSADGRFVVFGTSATDLVAGYVSGHGAGEDVYLYDRLADSISMVSRHQGSTTTSANGVSDPSDISADGRWIAFWSRGTDLISGQVGGIGFYNAFVYDRLSGTVALASHVPGFPLSACNSYSSSGVFSGDGSFMAFLTFATDVQAGVADNNGVGDVYLLDMNAGSNTLVSRRAPDLPTLSGNGFSVTLANAMSADGRFITYLSASTNLVPGQDDSNGGSDVFLADRLTRSVTLVSHRAASLTTAGNAASYSLPSISADGRWVAYASTSIDLVSDVADPAGRSNVYLYDRTSGTNLQVTRSADASVAPNGDAVASVISRDGRFVAFSSLATDVVTGQSDTNASEDVFLYDRMAGTTTLVSHAAGLAATTGNGHSTSPVISADGAFVAFVSGATNLAGGKQGAFLFERATGLVTYVGPTDLTIYFQPLAMSADGNWVAYTSPVVTYLPAATVPVENVFLFDRVGGSTTLVSHAAGSSTATGNSDSSQPTLSADGRFVAFSSSATDLVAGVADVNGGPDAFLFDRADGSVRLLSAATGAISVTSNGSSTFPVVSADGGRVAFLSTGTNLIPGQIAGPGVNNFFLYTRSSGTVLLMSGDGSSPTTGTYTDQPPMLSSDGGVVSFSSDAPGLVPGDFNATEDVFVFQVVFSAPSTLFYTVAPCRVVDTRGPAGPFGAPALQGSATRKFTLIDRCGIPLDAVAVSANVTAVNPATGGSLNFHPAGFAATGTSTLNYAAGRVRANNTILGLGAAGATAVDVSGSGPVDLVLDVNGYFK